MSDAVVVRQLTWAQRRTDAPFAERCRAMEPCIDAYLHAGEQPRESDRLAQGHRLVQAAGLAGPMGVHFGGHVVRHTALTLAQTCPRFVQARNLVEQLCEWPAAPKVGPTLWHLRPNRPRDQWAILLAAERSAAALGALCARWGAILGALDGAATPTRHGHNPAAWRALTDPLTPLETERLGALERHWSQSFGKAGDGLAPQLRPLAKTSWHTARAPAEARQVLARWRQVTLPPQRGKTPHGLLATPRLLARWGRGFKQSQP